MKNILTFLFVYLLVSPYAIPAFAQLSYDIDVGQDGTFETGGSINLNVNESVTIDLYVDAYSCPPNDQLFGIQSYITLDSSKASISGFPYDNAHAGPFDASLSGFNTTAEANVYNIISANFSFVTVVGNRQKFGTITLTGDAGGTFDMVVANNLTSYGYPDYNDGFTSDCNLTTIYPTDALLTINPGCDTNEQCNDNNPCTTDSCNKPSNVCIHTPVEEGTACDDGLFCNGIDTCNAAGTCIRPGDPCPDDELFCNGNEGCDENSDSCIHAGNPCPSETHICIEETDVCESLIPEVTLQLTPEAWYQSRWVSLIKVLKIEGTNSHFDRSVTEVRFSPDNAVIMVPRVIDETTIRCFGILMPRWWAQVDTIDVTVTTGAEEATATMEIKLLQFLLDQEKNPLQEE